MTHPEDSSAAGAPRDGLPHSSRTAEDSDNLSRITDNLYAISLDTRAIRRHLKALRREQNAREARAADNVKRSTDSFAAALGKSIAEHAARAEAEALQNSGLMPKYPDLGDRLARLEERVDAMGDREGGDTQ